MIRLSPLRNKLWRVCVFFTFLLFHCGLVTKETLSVKKKDSWFEICVFFLVCFTPWRWSNNVFMWQWWDKVRCTNGVTCRTKDWIYITLRDMIRIMSTDIELDGNHLKLFFSDTITFIFIIIKLVHLHKYHLLTLCVNWSFHMTRFSSQLYATGTDAGEGYSHGNFT